ncbi:MAG: hypothetical protein HKN20_06500 [Gemmatimonadetes bacterium]|nr:hypothetical protein [Gemmatimonadota bacterium]
MLTEEIIAVLQQNQQLKLTDEKRADSVIYGTIVDYKRTPYSYDSGENVQQYKVEIFARVEYEDRKKQKTLWKAPRMLGWSTYFALPVAGEEVEEEVDAQQRAVEKLAEDIKTKTVEGW